MTRCCPLSSSDDGTYETLTAAKRRAAKDHTCCECHETIQRGTTYDFYSGVFDGRVDTFKTCLSCFEIRDHFGCEGWIYGRLWEDLEENFFPDMKAGGPCMEGLSPEAKDRLFTRRMAWLVDR